MGLGFEETGDVPVGDLDSRGGEPVGLVPVRVCLGSCSVPVIFMRRCVDEKFYRLLHELRRVLELRAVDRIPRPCRESHHRDDPLSEFDWWRVRELEYRVVDKAR